MNFHQPPVTPPAMSLAGLERCTDLASLSANIVILGIHYTSRYPQTALKPVLGPVSVNAPDAIRRQSQVFSGHWDHYDFDFDGPLIPDLRIRMVDCGNVGLSPGSRNPNPNEITAAARLLLGHGAVPIFLGTDEGGLIPILRAYEGMGELCIVHIDAHIDWRDERDGVREGYSSVMRRASEMPWVGSMAQIGQRGVGSARQQEVDAALAFGSVLISARTIHATGVARCLERIPSADRYLISIDADALDIGIAPGVLFPSPGGLTFDQVTDLMQGIAQKGALAGLGLFEIRPERDVGGLTALTGAHLVVKFIGTLAHSGQISATTGI